MTVLMWFLLSIVFLLSCTEVSGGGRDNIQLAFGVMIYQKVGKSVNDVLLDFNRVFKTIYTPSKHVYILHLDEKSDGALRSSIDQKCKQLKNCLQIAPRNVAWAGLTTGEMMLALMQEAYESEFHFDYFVLLGHESIPLMSLPNIELVLKAYPPGTNFMNCWNVDDYNFFGQRENNTYRLKGVVVDSFDGKLLENINQQRTPPADISFYKSIQNFIVSRDFVRYSTLFPMHTLRMDTMISNR